MASKLRVLSRYLFSLFFITLLSNGLSSGHQALLNESEVIKPGAVPGQGSVVLKETRRRVWSFQISALCICWGGPYCYANIPNTPFGFCSCTPKAWNRFGRHY